MGVQAGAVVTHTDRAPWRARRRASRSEFLNGEDRAAPARVFPNPSPHRPPRRSFLPPTARRRVRAILYMLGMVVFGGLLAIFEFLVYPIVKLLDPTLFTYHRCELGSPTPR